MNKQDIEKEMFDWFRDNFIPPDQCSPSIAKDYGYQYICGGPYFADDVLKEEFGKKFPKNAIENAIAKLDEENSEWAKKH